MMKQGVNLVVVFVLVFGILVFVIYGGGTHPTPEELVCSKKIVVHRGMLITVNQVVDKSTAKQELGSRYNALAVDMETAPLVAHATHNNLSFLSVRAVSDTVEQSLVDVSSFISDDG